MNDTDPAIDRVRAALSSTDSELDADRLRVRLIVERAETPHSGKRSAVVHAAPGLVALLVAASVVVGIGYQARNQDRPEISAFPTGDVRPAVSPSPVASARSTTAGEHLLQRVTAALAGTRLTAFMTTKIDDPAAPQIRQTATVTHAPAEQMLRAELGDRAYLDLGHDARQILVDRSARRIWSAVPGDTSLAQMMNLRQIDPLAVLQTVSRDRSATRSESSDADRALLHVAQRGVQLDCVVDTTSYLPASCRTYAAGAVGGEATTVISWRVLTAIQWKTAFNVDTPEGYFWIKVPG